MRHNNAYFSPSSFALAFVATLFWASAVCAQTTSFTYQGRLSDGGTVANANYDLQFALFDSVSGASQIGATQTITNVPVSAGIFTMQLDFGASAFPGAPRFLEISARLAGTASFTTLSPRQQITSTPYAIRSLNASSADAVTVNGVPGGNGNYIQNNPPSQQAGNFSISGNGTVGSTLSAGVVNSATQYNIGGDRVLSITQSGTNAFVGFFAGQSNTIGTGNSFFGFHTGEDNTIASQNSFFGVTAGISSTGSNNTFFGASAGDSNTNGSSNTLIGRVADVGTGNLTNATALGANAQVDQSNALVLGSVIGVNGATASVNVGIGTTAPLARLHVKGDTIVETGNVGIGTTTPTAKLDIRVNQAMIRFSGVNCGSNFGAITFGNVALGCNNYSLLGEGVNTFINRPSGGVITFRENNNDQMVIQSGGNVTMNGLLKLNQIDSGLGAGTVQLCRNAANVIAVCTSSSLRYKQRIAPFSGGLDLVRRLHPISFTWKTDGSRDLGLGAEDVAKVEPLLVTHNDKGEIEGVKYDRLNVVLINAIKEQQQQIELLKREIRQMRTASHSRARKRT